jgi:hypothetical protein
MRVQHQPLLARSPCTRRDLTSFHYGEPGRGKKVYLQASLHADELPGMLVLHHLRQRLDQALAEGAILGEIVLVPIANPVGLEQTLMHDAMGRFDFNSGENFNRRYPDLAALISDGLEARLGQDAEQNQRLIRQAMGQALQQWPVTSELDSLRRAQLLLAHDADVVLDLHCDAQAVLHLYAETPYWPQIEPLARYLGVHASLLASGTGAGSFDEACGQPWWRLAERFGEHFPIPLGCASVTLELRGEADVEHGLAQSDAGQLFAYLQHLGVVDGVAPAMPALQHPATPFAGSLTLRAPCAGLVVFLHKPGAWISHGDPVVELIDPLSGGTQVVRSSTCGVMYMRSAIRFAAPGVELCKIAGAAPLPEGVQVSA